MSIFEMLRSTWQRIKADRFLLSWSVSSILMLLIPLISFAVARNGGLVCNEQYNDNCDYNRDNNYWQQNNEFRYDQYGNFLGQKHWWQFWKRNNKYDQNGNNYYNQNNNNEERGSPWWYLWTDDRPEDEQGSGTLVFVYVWIILSLVAMIYFGNRMYERGHYDALRWCFLALANVMFLVMVLVGGLGAIETEGRKIEETGWYGQTSVLLFLTCMFGLFQALVLQYWLSRKSKEVREFESRTNNGNQFELMGGSADNKDGRNTIGMGTTNSLV